jgi:anhydro-N-acetylmuramic acid kinase
MSRKNLLSEIGERDEFLAVGLMSGTSMDGVDAALVRLNSERDDPEVRLVAFKTLPYPDEQRENLMNVASGHQCTAADIACMNTGVAVAFSKAFFEVCKSGGTDPKDVDFIGSHGQTIAHVPPGSSGEPVAGTLQIGSPGMIAALTGVTTVGDFRVGDVALGGQGAPLAPYADYILRRSRSKSRVILNIGGIANVTYLPRGGGIEDTRAFDTGPGNMVSDAVFRGLYPGKGQYDLHGIRARGGKVNEALTEQFLTLPFFGRKPPKSAGHEEFGVHFAWDFLERARKAGMANEDILASALFLTARSVADALERWIEPLGGVDEVYVSGGGARNDTLVAMLRGLLAPAKVDLVDVLGIPSEAKEAVDFALLAREAVLGRINVIPSATGSSRGLVLGTIAPGSNP